MSSITMTQIFGGIGMIAIMAFATYVVISLSKHSYSPD